jgi:hypothetical protein
MRFIFFLAVVATLISAEQQAIPRATPTSADDRYSVSQVRSAVQFLQGKNGVAWSGNIKEYLWPLLALGDRVSIAILKIYTADELVQPDNAEAYLTVVRNAFSMRASVIEKSDIDPKVTLFVLEYLKQRTSSDAAIQRRIEYLLGCVKDFSCSSQGEYNFFHKS